MDYDALNANQRRAYDDAVRTTHRREVTLEIITKNGDPHRSLTNRFLGGSIQGDDTRTPVEVMEATILDDDYVLDWQNGQHRKYLARVVDSRFIAALDEWVDAVIFTGPLWDFERTGPEVSLVAQGSERLAMGSIRRVAHWPRKSKATAVLRGLLKLAGAPDKGLLIPKLSGTLPEAVTVGIRVGKRRDENGKKKGLGKDTRRRTRILKVDREDTYWSKAAPIAHALDRDLFSDGRGRYVMAPPAGKPTATLTDRLLTAPVKVKRGDEGEVTNTWLILGKDPKGPKKQIRAEVALPKKHPLSAQSLAWHGSPREVTETVENEHLKRAAQAVNVGKRLRDAAIRELVTYEIECLPVVPWIRPGALFSISTPGGNAQARAHQWTLPLGPDASPLVIGANRRSGGL